MESGKENEQIYPFSLAIRRNFITKFNGNATVLPRDGDSDNDLYDLNSQRIINSNRIELINVLNYLVITLRNDHKLQQHEINHYILFFEWFTNLWNQGIYSEFQGWDGTLINIKDQIDPSITQSKSAYVLSLELYYHLRSLPVRQENDETCFLRQLLEMSISEEKDEVLLEHYSMLGLYFYLRRSMSYEGFQFLGNLPPTIRPDCMSSGDICRDFIHAVDAYFATQIVWKVIGISSQGSVIALSNKYEELMEMYFRIKCYFSNGLIKTTDLSSWKNIYYLIREIFRTSYNPSSDASDSNDVDESQLSES